MSKDHAKIIIVSLVVDQHPVKNICSFRYPLKENLKYLYTRLPLFPSKNSTTPIIHYQTIKLELNPLCVRSQQ